MFSVFCLTGAQASVEWHVFLASTVYFFFDHPVLPYLVLFGDGIIPIQHLPSCGIGNESFQHSMFRG